MANLAAYASTDKVILRKKRRALVWPELSDGVAHKYHQCALRVIRYKLLVSLLILFVIDISGNVQANLRSSNWQQSTE